MLILVVVISLGQIWSKRVVNTVTRSVMSVTRRLDRPQMSNNENDRRVCVLFQIFHHNARIRTCKHRDNRIQTDGQMKTLKLGRK